jgi:hypothetical protein
VPDLTKLSSKKRENELKPSELRLKPLSLVFSLRLILRRGEGRGEKSRERRAREAFLSPRAFGRAVWGFQLSRLGDKSAV